MGAGASTTSASTARPSASDKESRRVLTGAGASASTKKPTAPASRKKPSASTKKAAAPIPTVAALKTDWSEGVVDAVEEADLNEWKKKQKNKSVEELTKKLEETTSAITKLEAQVDSRETEAVSKQTIKLRRRQSHQEVLEDILQFKAQQPATEGRAGPSAAIASPNNDTAAMSNTGIVA